MTGAKNKKDIDAAINAISSSMGFPLYTLMYAGFGGSGVPTSIVIGNIPDQFAAASKDVSTSRRDPVLRRLRSHAAIPFVYTQATYVNGDAGDLWEEQAPHGYRNGVAMALRPGRGRRLLIGFDTPDRISSDESARSMLLAQFAGVAVMAARTCDRVLGEDIETALAGSGYAALTRRESEVLPMIARGMSCPEIARALGLSHRTVEKYVQGVMLKLNARGQTNAVAAAMRMDLIDDALCLAT